jgi:hypothetical protein
MTDLGRFEEDDYMPDSGLLVVRDSDGDDLDDAHPCGTIVRTGVGWLYAGAGDGPCVVRIEAHPAEPSSEGEWDDLVEIPYRSTTGVVGLTTITMGSGTSRCVSARRGRTGCALAPSFAGERREARGG